jgi:thiamine-phosphate pyrophosphorylase
MTKLCHDHNALFIVNDRPDITALCGADGVHLGQDDVPPSAARRVVPSSCLIGVSTHTIEQVEAAVTEAPDYVAVGPMFQTPTKPQDHIAGPRLLTETRDLTSLPLVAIGGIEEHNVAEVIAAGANCVCVCSSVISQADVTAAASRLNAVIDRTGHNSWGDNT